RCCPRTVGPSQGWLGGGLRARTPWSHLFTGCVTSLRSTIGCHRLMRYSWTRRLRWRFDGLRPDQFLPFRFRYAVALPLSVLLAEIGGQAHKSKEAFSEPGNAQRRLEIGPHV